MLPFDDLVRIIELYHWHRTVISQVASIVSLRSAVPEPHASRVYAACKFGLLSEDASLRTSTLVLLKHRSVSSEIVNQALEVERVPLTPQDARDKNMHLRRLGIALKALDNGNSEDVEIGLLYSFAMLKVNFKPLWSEAIDVISEVHKALPSSQSLIWRILSEQLGHLARSDMRDSSPPAGSAWAAQEAKTSIQSSIAQWRQNDLICTALTRSLSKYSNSVVRFSELSQLGPRTHNDKEIQVRPFTLDKVRINS